MGINIKTDIFDASKRVELSAMAKESIATTPEDVAMVNQRIDRILEGDNEIRHLVKALGFDRTEIRDLLLAS